MIKKSIIFITSILILNSCNMNDYSELNEGIYASLETSKGDIILELFFKQTPLTVSNFVALSEGNHPAADEQFSGKPYYDGLKFHRVMLSTTSCPELTFPKTECFPSSHGVST